MVNLEYNNDVREIEMKLDFHFDNDIVPITKDNYLVEANILEETGSGDSWVLGDVSSNEISIKLMNTDNIFTPTNENSPYFGKIKSGIKIVPYFRIDKGEWLKMGEYFVEEWVTGVTDSYANIVANDALFKLFDSKVASLPVLRNGYYSDLFVLIFSQMGLSSAFDEDIMEVLPWGYTLNSNSETIQKLTQALIAVCSCNKNGDIYIRKVTGEGPPVATFKDSDQVIKIYAEHNIKSGYDNSVVTYNTPKESRTVELFSTQDVQLTSGRQELDQFQFSQPAVTSIESITSELTTGGSMNIVNIYADSKNIDITTKETTPSTLLNLSIKGKHVVENKISIGSQSSNVIELNNEFIQSRSRAIKFKNILDASQNLDLCEISVDIRGNPTINVGDKVRILSPLYNLDFEGIVKQAEYKYDGALSGKLKVINTNLVGVV